MVCISGHDAFSYLCTKFFIFAIVLSALGALKVAKVDVVSVPCTIVSMDFFNKLFRQGEL